jgi:Domain of unknown function (DUF4412)
MFSSRILFASLALLCLATAARADIKVKSRTSFGGQQGPETTTYIKGKRQRAEMPGQMATVTQCDLRRTVQMNGTTKTYTVSPFDDGTATQTVEAAPASAAPARKGGVVTTTVSLTDTGERKQMFGYTARRIKSSMVTESSPDACNPTKMKMESDGWYIDLNVEFDCYEKAATAYRSYGPQGGCQDTHRMKQNGAAKMGYPVSVTTTMFDETGRPTTSFTQEVLEISKATLDAALFDVPSDYRLVKDASEMYSAAAIASAASSGDDSNGSGVSGMGGVGNSSASQMPVNAQAAAAEAMGPKKPGVMRVGVATAKATAADDIDPNQLGAAVRNTMVSFLSGPAVEVVQLDARLPVQIELEARQKECDYVVQMTVAHKKGGGGFGSFMKKVAPVASSAVPYGGSHGEVVARSAATTAIYSAADFSGNVKSKDELTLEYSLQGAGGAQAAGATLKAKAKSDGQDLISTLVEQAATAVLAAATK